MNYKDKWVTDESGQQFVFTVEMQRKLNSAGLPVEPSSLELLPEELSTSSADESYTTETPSRSSSSSKQASEDVTITEPLTIQIDPQTGKYVGRMKWYNAKKGYGFLIRGGGEEIFFHKSGAVGNPTELQEGQWVLYDVEETRKGPEATEIEPYEGDTTLLT